MSVVVSSTFQSIALTTLFGDEQGDSDQDVPLKPLFSPILTDYLPKAKVLVLENAGHEIVLTHPDETSHAIIEFFNNSET